MANIVVNGRGTLFTSDSTDLIMATLVDGGTEWIQLQPSGTWLQVCHIVTISDTE